MAKLGEAYIQVLADLSKFDKSVDDAVKRSIQRLEKSFDKKLGEKLGKNVGDGFSAQFSTSLSGIQADLDKTLSVPANSAGRRVGRNFTQGVGDGIRDHDPITKALASLVSALEDGFSALPAEAKAAVGGFLIAAAAPVGAAVGAAFAAALVTGVTAGGVALAFQFEDVEERGIEFAESLRERLVSSAEAFGDATLNAIDELDYQIAQLEPTLKRVFDQAAVFADPLALGIGKFIDEIVQGLDRGLAQMDIQGFINSLVAGFEYLGLSIGDAFDILLANDNLDEALYDLFTLVGDLVTIGAEFLVWALDAYAALKPVVQVLFDIVETAEDLYQVLDKLIRVEPGILEDLANFFGKDDRQTKIGFRIQDDNFPNFNRSLERTITATEAAQKAVRELNRAMDEQRKIARGAIDAQIDYERAIDDITDALKKGKPSLELTKEAGRDLAAEYLNAIDSLDKFTDAQVAKGKLTEKQAKEFYDAQIKRLRDEFKARGGNLAQFDKLFADYIKLAGLPPIPDPTKNLVAGADNAFDVLQNILAILAKINAEAAKGGGNIKVPGGTQIKGYASGGFITQPSVIMAGEGYRDEVVLPLTDTRRSMDLLAKSPLAGLLNSNVTNVYAVFDGEPFQARIVRTARGVGRQSARTLSQVPRSI